MTHNIAIVPSSHDSVIGMLYCRIDYVLFRQTLCSPYHRVTFCDAMQSARDHIHRIANFTSFLKFTDQILHIGSGRDFTKGGFSFFLMEGWKNF
jgi:hypothetical protein